MSTLVRQAVSAAFAFALPALVLAAQVNVNLVFQYGSPVLTRTSMAIRFDYPDAAAAKAAADAYIQEFQKDGAKSGKLRDAAYRMVQSVSWPEGFVGERYYVEIDGQTVFNTKFRVGDFYFMRLTEQDAAGKKYTNYYSYSQGWRLAASTNPIVTYIKPIHHFWEIGGVPWVPPDYQPQPTPGPLPGH